ncbi:hypothetical protein [Fervidibacillus albus]|uniref:Mg2+ and Co2+ transporter CorB n=1 Tax=Fervidibacillus albus TaxID=2980026 RepID=A0A9E8LVY5_9BACI|nr:hypothetical protein [Fervidibacillus albus]WAA10462.1 hypothetical protein OE104_03800 [Fervidibacillus albus]
MRKTLQNSLKWSITIAVITFVLAAIFSILSNYILDGVTWIVGMIVVFVIVLIGILFDMIGIASTSADEIPFHSMAANKVYGSKYAIRIVRNADRVASFCNDVIGDIAGIISGTASAIVILQLSFRFAIDNGSVEEYAISVLFTSLIASFTVGGKAFGKTFAINYSKQIILQAGKLFQFLDEKFHIVIIKENRKR